MTDTSEYTLEYRILAACWYHECDKSISSVRTLKSKLREKFNEEPPHSKVIVTWEISCLPVEAFLTSSVQDDQMSEVTNMTTFNSLLSKTQRSLSEGGQRNLQHHTQHYNAQ